MRKTKMAKILEKIKVGAKEALRKFLVSLKRNPQFIPLAALTVGFLVYSLNLTDISNTTAKINLSNMGLCAFVSMLFSILSFICMLNAFPKRQKPNAFMIIVLYVLHLGILYADYTYLMRIFEAITRKDAPIKITEATKYIVNAEYILVAHMVFVVITMVCIALEPLFAKLLRKINTSVDVEDNGKIEEIELTDED